MTTNSEYNNNVVDAKRVEHLNWSASQFIQIPGTILEVEGNKSNPVCYWLDLLSGIDLISKSESHCIGIAARTQVIDWDKRPYNSFTIRYERPSGIKTEYEKRIESMAYGYIYPALTMQAYYSDGEFRSIGVCRTADLYRFIAENPDLVEDNISENKFKIVYWQAMISMGFAVRITGSFNKV